MIFLSALRPLSVAAAFFIALYFIGLWYLGIVTTTVLIADARARIIDAKSYMKSRCPKLKRKMQSSWCGRGALSSVDISYVDPRPYHILPDGFPHIFMKVRFWKSVLGIK